MRHCKKCAGEGWIPGPHESHPCLECSGTGHDDSELKIYLTKLEENVQTLKKQVQTLMDRNKPPRHGDLLWDPCLGGGI